MTGAIAKVDAEKLGDRPISDVSSALQGQMAGVEIRTTSGEPGKIFRFVCVVQLLLMQIQTRSM